MTLSLRTRVGPRGRVTIPVALQRDADLLAGTEVVVRFAGHGRVIVESAEAIKEWIRAGVLAQTTAGYDAVAEIRADRDADIECWAASDPVTPDSHTADHVDVELLRSLGID